MTKSMTFAVLCGRPNLDLYIKPSPRMLVFLTQSSFNSVSPPFKLKKCHSLLSLPSGNQIDGRAMVFPFSLKIVPVTLPILISMTCMTACTFMSHVFLERRALKSSEWDFVQVEFGILYHYLQTRKFLWILGLTKRWARSPSH